MTPRPAARAARLPHLDLLRGVAVLIMVLWHSVDSWIAPASRQSPLFHYVIATAGWAAPLFLFLAGIAIPLAGSARMARGATRAEASWSLQRRGWQVFVLAHLFHFQSFVLNPNASWSVPLKPDILNVLGLAIVAAAFCWGKASEAPRSLALWLVLPAAAILLVIAPWAPQWWWPTLLPPRLEAYIRPNGGYGVFSLFPASAYVFAGAVAGAALVARRDEPRQVHVLIGLYGVATYSCSRLLAWIGHLASTPWLGPAANSSRRIGIMLIWTAVTWWLTRGARGESPVVRPLLLFGQTSLFVYWIHVEMAYSNLSYPLHGALSLPAALAAYAVFTLGLFGLAVLWARRRGQPLVPGHMVAPLSPSRPERAGSSWGGRPAATA